MKLVVDVHYRDDGSATIAGLTFVDWTDVQFDACFVKEIGKTAPYEPGQFYKREMPCILELLDELEPSVRSKIELIIVDGFVMLGSGEKPGLGKHLYEALDQKVPIIGVAKTSFQGTPPECEIVRGDSKTPLYVTTIGFDLELAKSKVIEMHGPFRIPQMLRTVDQFCRGLRTR